jgi:hypothetical protein
VLAYAEDTARNCAGAGAKPSEKSSSQLVRLARAVALYQDTALPSHERTKATVSFEAALKELADEQLHSVVPSTCTWFDAGAVSCGETNLGKTALATTSW